MTSFALLLATGALVEMPRRHRTTPAQVALSVFGVAIAVSITLVALLGGGP